MYKKGQLNRAVLIGKATELIEQVGLTEMTLNRLAEELGIKPASLYNHIDSLRDLHCGLAATSMRLLGEVCRDVAVGKSGEKALMAMAYAYRQFARNKPQLYKAFMEMALLSHEERIEAGAVLTQTLDDVLKPYGYSEKETLHIVRGVRGFLHGFVSMEESGCFESTKASVDLSFEYLVTEIIAHIETHRVKSKGSHNA